MWSRPEQRREGAHGCAAPDLQSHRGYAEITFAADMKRGEGEYFNGLGRFTFGTMILTKEL